MNSSFLSFAWGIFILISLIGWGGAINRILFPKHRVDWGQRAAWGMAWSMCFGGVLNVTWTISQTTVLIYLALGFIYCLSDFYKSRNLFINSLSEIRLDRSHWLLVLGIFAVIDRYSGFVDNIKAGINGVSMISQQQIAQYIKMQESIPEGETLLTRLKKPFLLNFKRKTIFIADLPGGASPPPGMPLFKGSELLADYLTSQSIKYVAYSYGTEGGYPATFYSKQVENPNNWLENQVDNTWEFEVNLS